LLPLRAPVAAFEAPRGDGNRRDEDRRRAASSACKIDPSAGVCDLKRTDSRDSRSSARARCASKQPRAEMYAEFFLRRKSRSATPRSAARASSQTLSSRALRVVHEFLDMAEMPNSQALLRFVAIGSPGRSGGAREVEIPPSRRRRDPCCDALEAATYTFP
jgi:hypothetical protein